jgi:hypothetical protein
VSSIAAAIVMGPAGCDDVLDMDPPTRIVYQGEFESEVQACTRLSYDELFTHGRVVVNWETDPVQVTEDEDAGILRVEATTENVVGHAYLDWICDVPLGATEKKQATLVSSSFRESER